MDWYKITYRGRRRRSSFQIRGRGDLLEAERHNDVCVSGGAVVSAEVGSIGGRHYRRVGLVGGRVDTRSYEIVSPPEPRGRRALSVAGAGAK